MSKLCHSGTLCHLFCQKPSLQMSLKVNEMNVKSLPHKYLPPSPSPQTGNAQKDYALFVKALPIIGAVVQYLDVTRQLIVLLFTYRRA